MHFCIYFIDFSWVAAFSTITHHYILIRALSLIFFIWNKNCSIHAHTTFKNRNMKSFKYTFFYTFSLEVKNKPRIKFKRQQQQKIKSQDLRMKWAKAKSKKGIEWCVVEEELKNSRSFIKNSSSINNKRVFFAAFILMYIT